MKVPLECIMSGSLTIVHPVVPVHASILYQVYILLYSVRFACLVTQSTLNAFCVWEKTCTFFD